MAWFSWFQATTPATAEVETNPPFDAQAPIYRAGQRTLVRAALVASVGLLYQGSSNEEAQVTATQPDTYTQPVQGVPQYQASLARYAAAARIANPLLWAERADDTATELTPGVIPPVLGPLEFQQAQAALRARALVASDLLWNPPEDDSGPITTTELYLQPTPGVRALDQAARQFRQTARIASDLLWNEPNDGAVAAEADTWTQPIQGTRALGLAAAAWRGRVARMPLLWETSQDTSVAEAELYLQPVQGTAALARTLAAFRLRAGIATELGTFTPEDLSTDDTLPVVQPTPGTSALGLAARLYQWHTIAMRLGWNPATDGENAVPDTWIQPVQGTRSLGLASTLWRLRAGIAAPLGWSPARDVETAVTEVYTQPVQGDRSLGRQQSLYRVQAVTTIALRQTRVEAGTDVVGTQEAPYTQPVQGTRALAGAAQRLAARVQVEQALNHQSPDEGTVPPVVTTQHEDLHTLGAGPASHVGDQASLGGTWSGGS